MAAKKQKLHATHLLPPKQTKQVLHEINDYFVAQGISLDNRHSKLATGLSGGDKFKGYFHKNKSLFILDLEHA